MSSIWSEKCANCAQFVYTKVVYEELAIFWTKTRKLLHAHFAGCISKRTNLGCGGFGLYRVLVRFGWILYMRVHVDLDLAIFWPLLGSFVDAPSMMVDLDRFWHAFCHKNVPFCMLVCGWFELGSLFCDVHIHVDVNFGRPFWERTSRLNCKFMWLILGC